MRTNRLFLILAISMLWVFGCKPKTTHETHKKEEILKVMTYNIRLDLASDGINAWPNRSTFLSSQILFYGPDIMGVQEALPNQITDLKSELTNYKFIGKPIFGEKLEIPNWNSNPLEVKKPLLFFHFMAYFFIVIGLSLVISSLIHFFKLNVFGFDSIFLGIGTILGIRLLLKWERK